MDTPGFRNKREMVLGCWFQSMLPRTLSCVVCVVFTLERSFYPTTHQYTQCAVCEQIAMIRGRRYVWAHRLGK